MSVRKTGQPWPGCLTPGTHWHLAAADVADMAFAEPRNVELPAELRARFIDVSRHEPPIILKSTDSRLRYWPDTPATMGSVLPARPGLPSVEPSVRQIDLLLDQGEIQLADLAGQAGLSTERWIRGCGADSQSPDIGRLMRPGRACHAGHTSLPTFSRRRGNRHSSESATQGAGHGPVGNHVAPPRAAGITSALSAGGSRRRAAGRRVGRRRRR